MFNDKSTHWLYRTQIKLRLKKLRWWLFGMAMLLLVVISMLLRSQNVGGFGGHTASVEFGPLATTSSSGGSATSTAAASVASSDVQQGLTGGVNGTTQGDNATPKLAANTVASQRFVIETATLSLTVHDLKGTTNQLSQWIAADGGFIQSMQQTTNTAQAAVNMTLRIPESDFERVLHATKGLGQVTSFSQTGQDVTQQHNNMQAQIAQLESEAQAYTRLFSKAATMADMLQIQQSLVQVNNQIADLNSQLHDLNRSVQFATIDLMLSTTASPITEPTTPFIGSLAQSLHFMKQSALALTTLVAWVLPWAGLTGLIFGIRLWWLRRK